MNKKAIELSINFLVIIIISVVVFTLGTRFIYNLASETTKLGKLTLDELDKRIEDLSCQGSERVCISRNRKVISKGDFSVFGLKIINILEGKNFNYKISSSAALDKSGNSMSGTLPYLPRDARTVNIAKNDKVEVGIGIEVWGCGRKNEDRG